LKPYRTQKNVDSQIMSRDSLKGWSAGWFLSRWNVKDCISGKLLLYRKSRMISNASAQSYVNFSFSLLRICIFHLKHRENGIEYRKNAIYMQFKSSSFMSDKICV